MTIITEISLGNFKLGLNEKEDRRPFAPLFFLEKLNLACFSLR
jgi:hypothetical protein